MADEQAVRIDRSPLRVGRYAVYDELGAGGMATVYLARLVGEAGFTRTVALKRMHPHLARDREFVEMFLDEARLCSSLRHPNVVSVLDVVAQDGQLAIVMEYVHGESLAGLLRSASRLGERPSVEVAIAILVATLRGLDAAHEATSDRGTALGIVHRDVSPQNIVVGADGLARVLDFGIAKATGRLRTTADGFVKGKLSYMAPEQIQGEAVDARSDVFAAGIVLWELLTVERLFAGDNEWTTAERVLKEEPRSPSSIAHAVPRELDSIVLRALKKDPDQRFATAADFADALEECIRQATASEVGAWVEQMAGTALEERRRVLSRIESHAPGFNTTAVQGVLAQLSLPPNLIQADSTGGPERTVAESREPAIATGPLALREQLEEQWRQQQLWNPMPMQSHRTSPGFVLALVIVALVILYILIAHSYYVPVPSHF